MHVEITGDAVLIVDADNCRQLDVVSHAASATQTGIALAAAGLGGRPRGDAFELDVTALHRLARSGAAASDWEDAWDRMLAFASTRGWLSPDGRYLLAHVVADSPPATSAPERSSSRSDQLGEHSR